MGRKSRRHGRIRARVGTEPAPSATTLAEKELPGYLLIVAIACVVRLAVVSQLSELPIVRTPKLDSAEYLQWARQIAAGDLTWPSPPPHAPGYPFFIGGIFFLFGESIRTLLIVQALVGVASCAVVAALAHRYFDRRTGIAAGCLAAAYAPLVYLESSVLAEGLLVVLLVFAFHTFAVRRTSIATSLAAGFILGLAVIVRPTSLVLLPVLAIGAAWRARWSRAGWVAATALAAACLVPAAGIAILSQRAAGSPLLQAHAGMNFYIGNSPHGDGLPRYRLGSGWDRLEGEAARYGASNPAAQDRYYVHKTLEEIRQTPAAYGRLLASKALWTVQADEIRDSHSFYFFQSWSLLLRWLPTFGLLFPLAVCGIVVAVRQGGFPIILGGYLIAVALSCITLVVGFRYRMPLVPVLTVFAGLGVTSWYDAVRHRRGSAALMLAAVFGGAFALAHARTHAPSHDLSEEWAFTGSALVTERNLASAEQAYRHALELNPGLGLAWDGLGLVYYNQQRWTEAHDSFKKALSLDPDSARSHYHLGLVARREGATAAAIGHFRRALDLTPGDAAIMRELAMALARDDQIDEAATLLARVVARTPADVEAHHALAQVEASRGRFQEALGEAQKAAELSPDDGSRWLFVSALAVDAGDAAQARAAVNRAQTALGAGSPDVGVGWALVYRLEGDREAADRALKATLNRHPRFEPAVRLLRRNADELGRRDDAERFLRQLLSGGTT